MSNDTPNGSHRKQSLIAPISVVVAVLLIVAVALLLRPAESPTPPAVAEAPAAPPVVKIAPDPVLTRMELIEAAESEVGAYSAGTATPLKGRDPLAGRRFKVSIPFGCDGPQARTGSAQASYELDLAKQTLRLIARPGTWTTLPVIQELPPGAVEAAEGIWLPRPWSYSERCPPNSDKPTPATPAPPTAQTLGLTRLFEPGASRVRRRGEKPYEHVVKLPEENTGLPGPEGFRMVLEGVLSTFPDGRVLRCWSETPDHRPICLYAVDIERVAFEAGGSGDLIAEWRD